METVSNLEFQNPNIQELSLQEVATVSGGGIIRDTTVAAGGYLGGLAGTTSGAALGMEIGGSLGTLVGPEGTLAGVAIGYAIGKQYGTVIGVVGGAALGSAIGAAIESYLNSGQALFEWLRSQGLSSDGFEDLAAGVGGTGF
ncbi:hypothetical protein [Sphingomonas segetis]|jgi:hypothetical protein|uniref:hypothetical protein n=1 Tax=Sphingomonas segetis TaxID=1104779 RepID=UPI0012D32C88|nr:hypothetical protein [Sphingomonas segetis]